MFMAEKNLKNLFGLIGDKKSVPAVGAYEEQTRSGIQKAYIPKFLYKPPFGYPRYVDLPTIRRLAAVPYVDMCITTIIDEACAVPWEIVVKEGKSEDVAKPHIEHVKLFFDNPNTNQESFEEIRRKYLRDVLEIDAGVINKVFNQAEEMVEIVARAGDTFTKNPDIYGMFTDRDDLILGEIAPNGQPKENLALDIQPMYLSPKEAREKAAYFQYGWVSGARPVPFGKREIIWLERNPRTDSIYGRSPVQILAETIQTLIYAIEHNLEYFNDNSIPKGVLGFEGSDAEEIKALKEQWGEQQKKQDSDGNWKKDFHKLPMMGRLPKFERLQFSNAELELLEGQKWWAKLVWACFGVTSVELGYTEDAKGLANQIVQSNVFKKRCLYPLLRLEEYRINKEILSEFEYDDIEFKFIMFDVDEEMKKAQLYQTQIQAGYKSINEIRQEEGLEEVEWGEKMSEQERHDNEMEKLSQQSNLFGSDGREEANKRGDIRKEKENLIGKEKKSIETKPFGGYSNWDACIRDQLKKGKSKESAEKICGYLKKKYENKPSENAWQNNPLILGENEILDDQRLEKSIVYVLRQNEKKIKELIEKEIGKNKVQEIKALEDIAKAIKSILTFEGLKRISDVVIKNTFLKGWEDSEKQLNRNFLPNKEAIDFIQDYTFNNIKSMTEEIMTDLRQELERGIMAGEGIQKIKARVGKVFDVGENRAEMIARTEVARAEATGKDIAIKQSGEKFKKKIIITHDARTSELCKRLEGQTVGLYEKFKDKKTGEEWDLNPFHVNCRSVVVYIREDE